MVTLHPTIPLDKLQAVGLRALIANAQQTKQAALKAETDLREALLGAGCVQDLEYSLNEEGWLVPQATDEAQAEHPIPESLG